MFSLNELLVGEEKKKWIKGLGRDEQQQQNNCLCPPLLSLSLFLFQTTKAFLPKMLEMNHGHIVTVASSLGLFSTAGVEVSTLHPSHKSIGRLKKRACLDSLSTLARYGMEIRRGAQHAYRSTPIKEHANAERCSVVSLGLPATETNFP